MSVEKLLAVEGYLGYPSDTHPTTDQEMQTYMENQNHVLGSVVGGTKLWQPETEYALGAVIRSSSMPENTSAKVTDPGISGTAEPTWTAIGTSVIDGTCTCLMVPQTTESATVEDIRTGTSEILAITPAALKAYMTDIYTQAKLDAHPVGCIYESTKSTSPATLFGGTWVALDPGRVLLSQGTYTDSNGSVTYTAGTTGGERIHKLTVGEMPKIYGKIGLHSTLTGTNIQGCYGVFSTASMNDTYRDGGTQGTVAQSASDIVLSFGGDRSHNNVQPYTAVYAWRRTQ